MGLAFKRTDLYRNLEESELKKTLTLFGQLAWVKLVTNAKTGKRKGFGFVEMPVMDQAKATITALNEKEVYGRELSLKEAVEKNEPKKTVYFERPGREYRSPGGNANEEIGGKIYLR
jgi:RNA recognition motif-containing protein